MLAIVTRYAGPTDTRGARILATWEMGRLSRPYFHALDEVENHRCAALDAFQRMGLDMSWLDMHSGPTDKGYAHVVVPRKSDD
jgi:hypothetical protein